MGSEMCIRDRDNATRLLSGAVSVPMRSALQRCTSLSPTSATRFLKQFTELSRELAASLRWAAGKASEDGFIPPGDDDDDSFAARPEPDPAGYTSPDPHDGDPGPDYNRKRPLFSHGQSAHSMSEDDSGSDCDSTHTPDSLGGSPDHQDRQPETTPPVLHVATSRPEPTTTNLDPLAADDG